MLVYRLAKEKYIRDLLGTGARLYGGRWNKKGTSVLYTSDHCSLAVLELLVHTSHTLLPDNISLLNIWVPDEASVTMLGKEDLPSHWKQYPSPDALAEVGNRWAEKQESLILKVPSVLVPDEWNILLNPEHHSFKKVSVESVSLFKIDKRF